jgi:hypothetical protein
MGEYRWTRSAGSRGRATSGLFIILYIFYDRRWKARLVKIEKVFAIFPSLFFGGYCFYAATAVGLYTRTKFWGRFTQLAMLGWLNRDKEIYICKNLDFGYRDDKYQEIIIHTVSGWRRRRWQLARNTAQNVFVNEYSNTIPQTLGKMSEFNLSKWQQCTFEKENALIARSRRYREEAIFFFISKFTISRRFQTRSGFFNPVDYERHDRGRIGNEKAWNEKFCNKIWAAQKMDGMEIAEINKWRAVHYKCSLPFELTQRYLVIHFW